MAMHLAKSGPSTATCCCHKRSFSSGSHKRPSSHNTSAYEPKTKKLDSSKRPSFSSARLPLRPHAVKRDMRSPEQRVSTSCLDPEVANRCPPTATCGCGCGYHRPSFSSSHKRPSSHNTSVYEPKTKKLDSSKPPLSPLVDELQNLDIECPRTPSSINIASARLPPRPPAVKKDMRSPAQRVSTSCLGLEWRRKMTDCISRTRELLDYIEECANAQTGKKSDSPGCIGHNKNSDPIKVNNGLSGTVVVEKKGEALIVHVKCPCGAGYEILLLGGISYYKLM
ncbi:flocculation protein FLO11-like [Melia azedarach]|uniref:Flocculation protein FLO11-like n=1 Tax=Melia azedarach TaxID=155640 RepID=A0ACC1YHE7_MELAZ|nr:flocculation protein FLO11-like [Melia azedarach]